MAHAGWQENRDDELFFVEADSTASGWVFSERSTYEVRWFRVPPKGGWIDKANRLTSGSVAGSNGALARDHLSRVAAAQVEVGDYYDNASVLAVASWKINADQIEEGIAMLKFLRAHIVRSEDEKSRRLLLPAVEQAIEREFHRQAGQGREEGGTADPHGPAGEVPAFAVAGPLAGNAPGDIVSRFKLHMIDVVAVVTALVWTHSMLVHEITALPGLPAHPAGANVIAGSVLAIVLRLVTKTRRG